MYPIKTNSFVLLLVYFITSQILNAQSWAVVGGAVAVTNSSLSSQINAITVDNSGNIYATGNIRDSTYKYYVAKWNGTAWKKLPNVSTSAPYPFGVGSCIISDSIGNIYTAGSYSEANGNPFVTRWNGTSWNQVGTGTSGIVASISGQIYSLAIDKSGAIYAAGDFKDASGNRFVTKWNGSNWNRLGTVTRSLFNNTILSIAVDKFYNVYAAGSLSNTGSQPYVVKWNGNNWTSLGTFSSTGTIRQLTVDESGNVYAVGTFKNANGKSYVAKWDGNNWSEIGNLNTIYAINSISINKAGAIYVGGNFSDSNFNQYVAKWNGSTWSAVGSGTNTLKATTGIIAIALDKTGNLYVPGFFADKDNFLYVKKWTRDAVATELVIEDFNSAIHVHPNPGSRLIQFSTDEEIILNVYNAMGQLVIPNKVVESGTHVDVSFLQAGIYTLVLKGKNTPLKSLKWIKDY